MIPFKAGDQIQALLKTRSLIFGKSYDKPRDLDVWYDAEVLAVDIYDGRMKIRMIHSMILPPVKFSPGDTVWVDYDPEWFVKK